jgi:hypothetical protein
MFTVTELSPGTVSWVADETVAVSAMIVFAGVPAMTLITTWKLAVVAGASVAILQVMGGAVAPTAGRVHAQPTDVIAEKNVVFAGTASVKTTVVALAGPLLVTVCV